MSSRYISPRPINTAAFSSGGGCLSGYLLPPLAVVCVGAVLMFFVLGSSTAPGPVDLPEQSPAIRTSATIPLLSSIFTPEVQYWADRIQTWAAAAGLDPNLVATVMQIESCGDARALSRAGALGLFQVMPFHFTASDDAYAPNTNALRGLDYLRRSLDTAHGDPRLALAGYNGGISVIGKPESGWAPETQHYTYWGSGIYAEASSGARDSPRLQEWLAANGVFLCRQAHNRLGISP